MSAKGALHDGQDTVRHCERSFGTNVIVLGKQRDNFLSLSKPLERTSTKVLYRTSSELENSVLEIVQTSESKKDVNKSVVIEQVPN